MAESSEGSRSDIKWLVGIFGLIALVGAGTVGGHYLADRHRDQHKHGRLEFAHLTELGDGRAAIVVVGEVVHPGGDSPDTTTGRLDLVDATTGIRIARTRAFARDCIPASRGRLWCWEQDEKPRGEDGLVVRDLNTLGILATKDQMTSALPVLKQGIAQNVGAFVEPEAHAVIITTNDGRRWRIASAGCPPQCAASKVGPEMPSRQGWGFGTTQYGTMSTAKVGDKRYGFTSAQGRRSLVLDPGAIDPKPIGSTTFLEPAFLTNGETLDRTGAPPILLGDNVVAVAHKDSLDHLKAKTLVSALDTHGIVRWQATLGRGTVIAAWKIRLSEAASLRRDANELLIIALQEDEGWLIALDPRDGKERWRRET